VFGNCEKEVSVIDTENSSDNTKMTKKNFGKIEFILREVRNLEASGINAIGYYGLFDWCGLKIEKVDTEYDIHKKIAKYSFTIDENKKPIDINRILYEFSPQGNYQYLKLETRPSKFSLK
jgi:hypothetical protein